MTDNPKVRMMRAWEDLHWAAPRTKGDPASVRALDDIRNDFMRMADNYCTEDYSSPRRKLARAAYSSLLEIPLASAARLQAGPALAFLRDFIAYEEGRDAEEVQTEYENKVVQP
jgi:hypothetical protein